MVMEDDTENNSVNQLLASCLQQPDDELGDSVNPSLACRITDETWQMSAVNPDPLKLKETYQKLAPPSNIQNLTETNINRELKNMLPKSDSVPDMRHCAIWNAI